MITEKWVKDNLIVEEQFDGERDYVILEKNQNNTVVISIQDFIEKFPSINYDELRETQEYQNEAFWKKIIDDWQSQGFLD